MPRRSVVGALLLAVALLCLLTKSEARGGEYDRVVVDDDEEPTAQRVEKTLFADPYRDGLVVVSVGLAVVLALVAMRLRRYARDIERLNGTLESRVEERTRQLSQSREQFRSLVETTHAIPWETAPDALRFSYVAPQLSSVCGGELEDWTRDGFFARAVHAEDRDRALAWLEGLAKAGDEGEHELRFVGREGDVWVRAFGRAATDASGRLVRRGLFLDVTDRRQLELELGAAHKLESVGRLAAGVAHEINTPVQFVSDSVHFVRETFKSVRKTLTDDAASADPSLDDIPDALDTAMEGLTRIATIVRALNEFSRPDRAEKAAFDLNAGIRSTLAMSVNEYKHVAKIVTELDDLPPVVCNGGQMNQVFLNLVVNAAHTIGDVVKESRRLGMITIRTWREDGAAFVSVSDTGRGIPVAARERIFEPFFTTKDVGRGTGQGLAIARTIVDQHGGRLSFETELGRGTTFTIRLPVDGGRAMAA